MEGMNRRRMWKRIHLLEQVRNWAYLSEKHRGTKPRKARVGRVKALEEKKKLKTKRRRARQQLTKRLRQARAGRGRNLRTGG